MRSLAFLILLFTASALPAEEAVVRDLLVVAGQSNAVGFDALPKDLPANADDAQTLFWWRCGDPPPDDADSRSPEGWTTLKPQPKATPLPKDAKKRQYGNFANPAGGFGPEMGLVRTLREKDKKPLAVVKTAFSGTGLGRDWNPTDPGEAGSCYRAMISELKAAMEKAKAQGITLKPRAVIWVQGESDANATDAPLYAERLVAMMSALRTALNAPDLAVLVGVNTEFGAGRNTFMPAIVEAQKQAAKKLPRAVYVDTAGAQVVNPAHFGSAGTLDVGRRFADALLKLESAR